MLTSQYDVIDDNRYLIIMDPMPSYKAKKIEQRKGTIRAESRGKFSS
jgi:hypothetical protein